MLDCAGCLDLIPNFNQFRPKYRTQKQTVKGTLLFFDVFWTYKDWLLVYYNWQFQVIIASGNDHRAKSGAPSAWASARVLQLAGRDGRCGCRTEQCYLYAGRRCGSVGLEKWSFEGWWVSLSVRFLLFLFGTKEIFLDMIVWYSIFMYFFGSVGCGFMQLMPWHSNWPPCV